MVNVSNLMKWSKGRKVETLKGLLKRLKGIWFQGTTSSVGCLTHQLSGLVSINFLVQLLDLICGTGVIEEKCSAMHHLV